MIEKKLIERVEQWGEERNFYGEGGTTREKQFLKLYEELGELIKNYNKGKSIQDDIGDFLVVVIHIERLTFTRERKGVVFGSLKEFDYDVSGKYMVDGDKCIFNLIEDMQEYRHNRRRLYEVLARLENIARNHNLTFQECLEHAYDEIKDRKGKFVNGMYVKEEDLILEENE